MEIPRLLNPVVAEQLQRPRPLSPAREPAAHLLLSFHFGRPNVPVTERLPSPRAPNSPPVADAEPFLSSAVDASDGCCAQTGTAPPRYARKPEWWMADNVRGTEPLSLLPRDDVLYPLASSRTPPPRNVIEQAQLNRRYATPDCTFPVDDAHRPFESNSLDLISCTSGFEESAPQSPDMDRDFSCTLRPATWGVERVGPPPSSPEDSEKYIMPPPTRRGTPLPIVEEKGWTSSMALKPTIYSPIGKDRIQNSTLVQRTEKGDRKARNPYESTKCKSKRGDPSSVVDEEISPDVADRHWIYVPGPSHHSLEPMIVDHPSVPAEVSIEDGTRNSTLVQRIEKSARKGARKPYESSKRKSTRRQVGDADSESQDVIYAPSHGDSLELPEDDQNDPTHIGQTSTTALQWVEPPRSLPLVQRTKKSRIRKRASSKPYGSKQSKAEFESKNIVYAKAAERRRELDDMEAVSAFSTIHARCATTGVGIKLDDRNKSDKGYNSGFIVKHLGKCAAMKNKAALGNDDCAEKITPYSVFCTRCNTEVDLHGDSKRLKELELKLGGWRKALEGKGSYEGKEEAPFTEEERNDKSRHLLCKEWYATERWEKHKRACKGGRRG